MRQSVKQGVSFLLCGLVFGLGLALAGMTQPLKVQAFLDVAGNWDPSLALVMVSAIITTRLGYLVAKRRPASLSGAPCQWPGKRDIDASLVVGALLFGAGWGLSGICPGPAIATLAVGGGQIALFVAAMMAGMGVHALTLGRRSAARAPATSAESPSV